MRRSAVFTLGVAVIGAAGVSFGALIHSPRLVWNTTQSAPLGLYRLDPAASLRRGDLVLAEPPLWARKLAAERSYLPFHVPLIKRIAADMGDNICSIGTLITINKQAAARRLLKDSLGRPLPYWTGCRTLEMGQTFLLMARVSTSFDGRYFGLISRYAIIGKLDPLWTW